MQSSFGRLIKDNLWTWTLVVAAIAVISLVMRARVGLGYHLGDLAALCGMLAGTFIMLHVDKGRMAQAEAEADDAE